MSDSPLMHYDVRVRRRPRLLKTTLTLSTTITNNDNNIKTIDTMKRVKLFALINLLFIGLGHAWGEIKSVTLADGTSLNNVNTWSITDVITITQAAGTTPSGKTQTDPNSSYIAAPRWYTYNDITFTPASGVTIGSVVVTATTSGYAEALANSSEMAAREEPSSTTNFNVVITPTDGTSSFVITMGGQCRLNAISVNIGSSSSVTYTDDFFQQAGTPAHPDRLCIPKPFVPN